MGRRIAVLLGLTLAGAGCGSGHSPASTPRTVAPVHSTSSTTHPTAPSTTTTLPAPSTAGPLVASATIPLGITPGASNPVAAEAPDGAVFVANPGGGDVLVVHGTSAPSIAEHVSGTVNALAADAENLFVATYTSAYQYSRRTGSLVEQWTLPPVSRANTSNQLLVGLTVAGGAVWVLITQGNDVDVYRVTPGSADPPVLVEETLGAVVGPDATLYYERLDGQLVRQDPSDVVTVGQALSTKPAYNGGTAPYIVGLAGGYLWTEQVYGQGIDAGYQGYNAESLSYGPWKSGTVGAAMLQTLAGALWRTGASSSACPTGMNACVLRLSASAYLSEPYQADPASLLLGPYPVLVEPAASGGWQMVRLA
ncbi:MAG TPA: hypothetical protein VFH70_06355 [Acidimicrobiales bacterium]|nr:hypothetical protein [Acidimicrobiales bacterium]